MSLRYGTLPIVRETGGLKDTVVPYNEFDKTGTGFSFANYNAHEMMDIIRSVSYTHLDVYKRQETDCVLTLGGDGTLIQAVRELRNKHLPLIGVNMGTLGYLTEIELPKIEESLEKLFCGAFLPERRMMLQDVYKRQVM